MKEIICYTGGATGSDIFWERSCEQKGIKVVSYSFEGHKSCSSYNNKFVLTKEELSIADEHLFRANVTLRRYLNPKVWYYPLLQRNYYQIKDVDTIIAVGKLDPHRSNIVDGGTGWAIQMAIDLGKKNILVFNQHENMWRMWDSENNWWSEVVMEDYYPVPLIPNSSFAGIGTRKLEDNGKIAITNVINSIDLDYGN